MNIASIKANVLREHNLVRDVLLTELVSTDRILDLTFDTADGPVKVTIHEEFLRVMAERGLVLVPQSENITDVHLSAWKVKNEELK